MKKLFTLVAAAFIAASVNAKENLDLSTLYSTGTTIEFTGGWQWKGLNFSTGELIQDEATQTTDDTNVVYLDASAYDYLVVKYSASTCDVNLIIQYNATGTIGQWGPEFNQGQVTLDKKSKGSVVGLKLDGHKNTVNAVAFQNQNDNGTLTIEECYWATTAEYEAAIADQPVETTKEIDFTSFGGYEATLGAFYFKAGEAGWYSKWFGTLSPEGWNSLVIEVASSTGDVQLVTQGDAPADAPMNLMIYASTEAKKYYLDLTGWTNISQAAFQNFNFALPDIEDWNEKQASAMETTMVVTAMYLSKEAAPASEETVVSRIAFTEEQAGDAVAEYKDEAGSFILSVTDTDGKVKVDANNAYFGTATSYENFAYRLKSGGKSSSKNNLALTIPADGTLKVYARTGSNSAEDRTVVLTQNETELYNQVVKEADAVLVRINEDDENDTKIYPVIAVDVKAGTVEVTYPVGSINFYGFDLVTAGATGIQETVSTVAVSTGVVYNLRGQKVDASSRGIVIRDGKKFFQK